MRHIKINDVNLTSFSSPPEHPPVFPEDSAPILPPGTGLVRPDERVQMEPHHPDRQRRPRGPGCSKEARDSLGGERNEGETLGFSGLPSSPTSPIKECVSMSV